MVLTTGHSAVRDGNSDQQVYDPSQMSMVRESDISLPPLQPCNVKGLLETQRNPKTPTNSVSKWKDFEPKRLELLISRLLAGKGTGSALDLQ